MNQPLLIVGMHRSGTSMMTRILMHQGVFLGSKRQGDDEALHFLNLNVWMHSLAGTDWDHPLPCARLMEREMDVERIADVVRTRLKAPYTMSYFGKRMLQSRGRAGPHLPFKWGFKDPRTSITLPVWLKIFPEARILRMQRHGMDVAASLNTRFHKLRREKSGRYQLRARIGYDLPMRTRLVDHVRCATIKGGLDIWDEYETTLDQSLENLPSHQKLSLRYEEYVLDPARHHDQISDFLDIKFAGTLPPDIKPDLSRVEAWRHREELCEAAAQNSALLERHGYRA